MKNNKILLLIAAIGETLILGIITLVSLFITKDFFTISNYIFYPLCIIGIILFFIYSFSKKDINRALEFIISLIFLCSGFFTGILGFIYFAKSSTYKKRELPKLEILHTYPWYIYLLAFILCMVIMFVLPLFFKKMFGILYVRYGSYLFILAMLIFLFRKDLVRDFKYFKEYHREYIPIVFKYFAISFAFQMVISILVRSITGINQATNQESLNLMFTKVPLLVIVLACIYAPLSEELMFRGIFRKLINNKWVFILLCGFLFGLAHVIDDFKQPSELLFTLVYMNLGCFMAALYYKTNNIFTNIMFHFTQNTISIIAMFLLSLFPQAIMLLF